MNDCQCIYHILKNSKPKLSKMIYMGKVLKYLPQSLSTQKANHVNIFVL